LSYAGLTLANSKTYDRDHKAKFSQRQP